MTLSDKEAQDIGTEEEVRWQQVYHAILDEIGQTASDYNQDRKLARQLTSELVASTRDEDKIALASDEAVAHGLTKLRKSKATSLDSLEEQPYFARVITEEENKKVEFRLGTASFPAQRIIDWRKAPISKLYYDYKEGDEFFATIQGQEREGFIKLRRSYHGARQDLNVIETSQATLHRINNQWKIGKSSEPLSRADNHDGHLPPILSLITPEQFKLITNDAKKPVVIQGIAGSGKTTVALHRLAWLLHEDNSEAKAAKCLVVMFNRSLKAYVELTLPELKIDPVPIRTFYQWANHLLTDIVGVRPRGIIEKSRSLEQFKSSAVCLKYLFDFVQSSPEKDKPNFIEELFGFLKYLTSKDILWPKWDLVRTQLKQQVEKKVIDVQDDPLILHLIHAKYGYYPAKSKDTQNICDHIIIDEAQDFGLVEIRALLNALDTDKTVTIVGDMSQKIVMGKSFDSWEEILKQAGFEDTTPISLTVSHRTTEEIMAIASHVRGTKDHGASSGRSGPEPTFFEGESPQVMPHIIGQWIKARLEENNHVLCAIICRWPKQAQALVDELRKIGYPYVRLGHRDQFDFSPGIIVTNIHQVKGLEFRNVLVVEPSEEHYHADNEEERNLLYVAVTRAELCLDFIGCERPSSILPRLKNAEPFEEAKEEAPTTTLLEEI